MEYYSLPFWLLSESMFHFRLYIMSFLKLMTWAFYLASVLVGIGAAGNKCDVLNHTNVLRNSYYRPKRSFGQGNIFTPVCHSVHRMGGAAGWRTPPPGWRNPPGLDGEPPPRAGWRTPPQAGWRTPPDGEPPPPGSRLRHTAYDRPVRILLECILVTLFLFG